MGDLEAWDDVALIRGGCRSLETTGSRYCEEEAVPVDGVMVPGGKSQPSVIMCANNSVVEWDLCSCKCTTLNWGVASPWLGGYAYHMQQDLASSVLYRQSCSSRGIFHRHDR